MTNLSAGEGMRVYLPEIVGGGYRDFWNWRGRYAALKGGKASKKTKTTSLRWITLMMKPEYHLANLLVIRNVMATNRDSTFADLHWAIRRLKVERWWKITKSPLEMIYLPTGQKIIFRGMDDVLKLAGITVPVGYLCWVWLEEAFEIQREEDFDKLDLSVPRGEVPPPLFKQTVITLNPWKDNHWVKARFFDNPPDNALVMTTDYRCNEFLDDTDRAVFERMRVERPRMYDVVGLGNWGVSEGLVFENWTVQAFDVKQVTAEKDWQWRHAFGLDYGYTNDPTAFIAVVVNPLEKILYIYDEHYECKMLNTDIAAMIVRKGYQKERIRADAAEPKSNDDLKRLGIYRLHPAEKGRDSVMHGIVRLQEYRIVVHPRCIHTIGELGAYCWKVDKAGKSINEPVDRDNHLMDALRYAMEDVANFHPTEEKPRPPRRSTTAVSGADLMSGEGL